MRSPCRSCGAAEIASGSEREAGQRPELHDLRVDELGEDQRERIHDALDRFLAASKIRTVPGPPGEYASVSVPSAAVAATGRK
jgi:hypothetical protein